MAGLSRPCRGEVVPSPCTAGLGPTFPYPQHGPAQHILYFIRPRVLRSYSTVHMVLEHFQIVVCAVTPKLPMHETIGIPRKCPSGNAVNTAIPCQHGLCSQMACVGRATRERRQTMKQKFKTITGSHRDYSLALLGVADVLQWGGPPVGEAAQNPNTEASPLITSQECPEASRPRYCSLYQKASQCLALPRAGLAQGRATLAQGHKYAPPQNNGFSFTLHAKLLSRGEWGEVPRIKVAQQGRMGRNPSEQSCSAGGKSIGSKLLSRG